MINLAETLNGKEKQQIMESYDNPFKSDKVTQILMCATAPLSFQKEPTIWATVTFKNNDTKGEQNIKANSLPELFVKVEQFIKSLDKSE